MRLGMSTKWRSRWFSDNDYARLLRQDVTMRKFLKNKLREAGLDMIEIERSRGEIVVTITAAKPGLIIGRGGTGIDDLKKELQKKYVDQKTILKVNIQEVDNPNLSAGAVLQVCIADIEKRIPFRRVLKQNIEKVSKAGAKGVKISMAGRLNGADIARTEKITQGTLPLHTLRANIDYSRGVARTTYGAVGIKVWIYKGLYFAEETKKKEEPVINKRPIKKAPAVKK